jgi:hypothetical protein
MSRVAGEVAIVTAAPGGIGRRTQDGASAAVADRGAA